MDPTIDPSTYGVGGNAFGFTTDGSVGPQSDGTVLYPSLAQPVNQASDVGAGSSIAPYTPQILQFLQGGLGMLNQDYQQGQMLNYASAQATQGGLIAQGQAAATVASAQISAMASSKNLLVIGLVVALVVFLKG
jgi:hypothetical protein